MNFYKRIDNKKLYLTIKKYKDIAINNRNKFIPIPDYIQISFWIMANKYSYINKFINYSFKKDMVSEAVIICLKYLNTFNVNRNTSPYCYFTQAIHNSFLQTIAKEKKQVLIKEECLIREIERREGPGRKVGEKQKDMEEKIWN